MSTEGLGSLPLPSVPLVTQGRGQPCLGKDSGEGAMGEMCK